MENGLATLCLEKVRKCVSECRQAVQLTETGDKTGTAILVTTPSLL
jgi:hypothetical protein